MIENFSPLPEECGEKNYSALPVECGEKNFHRYQQNAVKKKFTAKIANLKLSYLKFAGNMIDVSDRWLSGL